MFHHRHQLAIVQHSLMTVARLTIIDGIEKRRLRWVHRGRREMFDKFREREHVAAPEVESAYYSNTEQRFRPFLSTPC
jgi:hypothetical protein